MNNKLGPKEIEFKYFGETIPLSEFQEFCTSKVGYKFLMAAGYDHFYENGKNKDAFCRLRVGSDFTQLTFKRKTKDENNFVRAEHNITLSNETTKDQIEAFLSEFDYKFNMSLYKSAFIYLFDYYILVYYICYDMEMKEIGRFIEIEMKEDYPWKSEDEAYSALVAMERLCKPLGISAQSRVKRSLFEMFRKEEKK